MSGTDIAYFGSNPPPLPALVRCRSIRAVLKGASLERIGALVVDARNADDALRTEDLLRALYDDPRGMAPGLHPRRVLALVPPGDLEVAFALGRYGIAGVLAEASPERVAARVERILRSPPETELLLTPVLAPGRAAPLAPPGDDTPTVAIGYRHAPETLALIDRYVQVLRSHAPDSSVFADVARLLEVLVRDGLSCQTQLACKVGAAPAGQFIGALEFYRTLRHTRYRLIPDPGSEQVALEVFIAIDEILHDVLHLVFLANHLRAGLSPRSTQFAEELSVSWWQAVIHNRVFPDWLDDRRILEINDDFLLAEQNQSERDFWKIAYVFGRYQQFPWVRHVLQALPQRQSYIGERPDLTDLVRSFERRPEARFAVRGGTDRLRIPVPFAEYPANPLGFRISAAPFHAPY